MDKAKHWYNSWRTLATVLFISCIGILIRSGFRVTELSQGFDGPLTTNEALFYGLDTFPLFIAVALYIPFLAREVHTRTHGGDQFIRSDFNWKCGNGGAESIEYPHVD